MKSTKNLRELSDSKLATHRDGLQLCQKASLFSCQQPVCVSAVQWHKGTVLCSFVAEGEVPLVVCNSWEMRVFDPRFPRTKASCISCWDAIRCWRLKRDTPAFCRSFLPGAHTWWFCPGKSRELTLISKYCNCNGLLHTSAREFVNFQRSPAAVTEMCGVITHRVKQHSLLFRPAGFIHLPSALSCLGRSQGIKDIISF